MIDARRRAPDDAIVTRRAWGLLAVGLATAVAFGGFAFAHRGTAAPFRPSASWNMYSPAQWTTLVRRSQLTGLHVVSATSRRDGTPLALLAGGRDGQTCFTAADGLALRPAVCRLKRPVTLFPFRDGPMIALLGVARREVASLATRVVENGRSTVSGAALVPVPGGFAFGSGYRGSGATLIARDARTRIVARIVLRR